MKLCQIVNQRGITGNFPPKFSKAYLVFRYTKRYNHFLPENTTSYNHFAPPKISWLRSHNRRSGSLCTESEISHFEIVESNKAGASDEACEDENSKFVGTVGLPNDSATWPVFMSRNVRNYLTQRDEPPTVTSQKKSSTEKRAKDTVFYVPLQKCTAKW